MNEPRRPLPPIEVVDAPAGLRLDQYTLRLIVERQPCPDCEPTGYRIQLRPGTGYDLTDPAAWTVGTTHASTCPGWWLAEQQAGK